MVKAGVLPLLVDISNGWGSEKMAQNAFAALLNIGLNGPCLPTFPPSLTCSR